ncbi:MAG TPA: molybdate ABC transporter substrate-binding protein [Dongiaceae bacterium]|nr:molybdate ABC transporter substrate-binding protein [Dongiaceae bacterium]
MKARSEWISETLKMQRRRFFKLAGQLAFGALLLGTGVAVSLGSAQADDKTKLTIFGAASLQNALDEIDATFAASHPVTIAASYASSSVLAKQIEAGAAADIFISADRDWMKYVADKQLIRADSNKDLLGNELVLVGKADDTTSFKLTPGADLLGALGSSHLAMGEVKSVPAGKYGKAALEKLGIWDKVQSRVAGAENVRAALKLVALGEAKYGIVYASDAVVEKQVRVVDTFPEDSHPPIVYPIAITKTAAARQDGGAAQAQTYYDYLHSSEAAAVFKKYGFTPLN